MSTVPDDRHAAARARQARLQYGAGLSSVGLACASLLIAGCAAVPGGGTHRPPSDATPTLTAQPSIGPTRRPAGTAPPATGATFTGRWQSVAQSTRQIGHQLYLEIEVESGGDFSGRWSLYACDSLSVPTNCRRREQLERASGFIGADARGWLDLNTGDGPLALDAEMVADSLLALSLMDDPFASSPGRHRRAELLRVLADGSLATPGNLPLPTLDVAAGPTLPPDISGLLPLPAEYRVWSWTEYSGRYNVEIQTTGAVGDVAARTESLLDLGLDVVLLEDRSGEPFPSVTWQVDGGGWFGTIHAKQSELDPPGFLRIIYVFDVF